MTRQRRVVLEELKNLSTHPTADQIYDLVRKRLPEVSLGTVYRNLDSLAGEGLIRKISLAGTRQRFDGRVEQHYHLRCLACGKVEDLRLPVLSRLEKKAGLLSGYQITGHCLEFYGLCPACRSRAERDLKSEGAKYG